ncbi:MAG TPA: NAD(P)H-dependent oxidoreductase subunit E [Chitinophagales bacterium]|nr:NAD(P)H-dependent oxidoreductase subunit E [Chitinophagales bacterium]
MLAVKTGKQLEFSSSAMEQAKKIISSYPEGKHKSALLPLLHLAQDEFGGYLSVESMDYVARLLNIQPIEVYEVATFYSMYNLKPGGRFLLEVCHTGPCEIRGAEKLISTLQNKLGIEVGETTADGLFTLKRVECLAACGYAPMLQCGERFHEFLDSEEKVEALLNELRRKVAANN